MGLLFLGRVWRSKTKWMRSTIPSTSISITTDVPSEVSKQIEGRYGTFNRSHLFLQQSNLLLSHQPRQLSPHQSLHHSRLHCWLFICFFLLLLLLPLLLLLLYKSGVKEVAWSNKWMILSLSLSHLEWLFAIEKMAWCGLRWWWEGNSSEGIVDRSS